MQGKTTFSVITATPEGETEYEVTFNYEPPVRGLHIGGQSANDPAAASEPAKLVEVTGVFLKGEPCYTLGAFGVRVRGDLYWASRPVNPCSFYERTSKAVYYPRQGEFLLTAAQVLEERYLTKQSAHIVYQLLPIDELARAAAQEAVEEITKNWEF